VKQPTNDLPENLQRRALTGIRVVDVTHILAGPYASLLLADAGAEVIKVEPPWGEYSRTRGAIRTGPDGSTLSSYSAAVHRGKRSIALDLKSDAGKTVFRRLLARADVVIENLAPNAMTRLGFSFDQLRAEFPRLITCSISLYGSAAGAEQYSSRGGLAIIAESESGLVAMNRPPGGAPRHFDFGLGDTAAGLSAYAGIVTALLGRDRTGRGQHVGISMVRSLLWFNGPAIAGQDIGGPAGTDFRTAALGIFPCSDGFVAIGVNSDVLWARLAAAMGRPELADDERYAQYAQRDARADEVDEAVTRWTSVSTVDAVVRQLIAARVPSGPVNTPADVLDGELASVLGFIDTIPDGLGGDVHVAANPLGLPPTLDGIPRCGEHTTEVLRELGIGDSEAQLLRERGAFGPSQ
jgi:crotonobetainyl-CoA:carnitine CoA-transferase CaiB-like acyl-CoA transferase